MYRDVTNFLLENDINPLYFVTVIVLLIVYSYKNDFQDWKNVPGHHKGIILSACFGAIVFSIFSILMLLGIIGK